MKKPPNHREIEIESCGSCDNAVWTLKVRMRVIQCDKYKCWTSDDRICDDWEREQ